MVERRTGDRRDNSDERTRALSAFAESQAKVGGAISDLGAAIDYLVGLAKWFIGIALIVGVLVAVGVGFVFWNDVNAAHARTELLHETAVIKRTGDEVHSAVTPGQPLYAQAQQQQVAVISQLVDEIECRQRNALNNGPDVPGDKSCLALHPELQGAHP